MFRTMRGQRRKEKTEIEVWLQGCFQRDHRRLTNFDMDVFSAKVKMVDLVIDLNLPMSSLDKLSKGMKKMFHDSKIGKPFQCARSKGTAIAKEMSALLLSMPVFFSSWKPFALSFMIKLWFVPEILVVVCEMSLKFDFGGRHACCKQSLGHKHIINLSTLNYLPNTITMLFKAVLVWRYSTVHYHPVSMLYQLSCGRSAGVISHNTHN